MAETSLPQALKALNATLRAGQITAIAALSEDLESCLSQAEHPLSASPSELQAMRAMAAENQLLLDAVGRGLRQAAHRLAEIADARRGLRTYGPGGASRAWVDQTGQGNRF